MSAAFALRPPAPGERAGLADLWVRAWRQTFPQIDFEARRPWLTAHLARLEADGARLVAAFAGEAPAGFVVVDPRTGWLDQIVVDPAHFGAGAAAALMAAARAISPRAIALDVNADNIRALAFYAREGFAVTGGGVNPNSGLETRRLEWRAGGEEKNGEEAK